MERETGFEPATSSLGRRPWIENSEFGVHVAHELLEDLQIAVLSAPDPLFLRQVTDPSRQGTACNRPPRSRRSPLIADQKALFVALRSIISGSTLMSYADLAASELFERCATSRDRPAWVEFHRRYHRTIAGVVVRVLSSYRLKSNADVEDLIQNVYLRLCQHDGKALRSFVPAAEHSDFAYLKVIARHIVDDGVSARNKDKRVDSLQDRTEDLEIQDTISVKAIDREVLLGEIERMLRQAVTDRDRRIFWLYYRAGLTADQIGSLKSIGLSPKGVESALARVTSMLREKLAKAPAREGMS